MENPYNTEHWKPLFREFILKSETPDIAHDLSHVQRVLTKSLDLGKKENAKPEILYPAAWLHDCVSVPKNSPERQKASLLSAETAVRFLKEINYPEEFHQAIHHAIHAHSFSANIAPEAIEAKVLQDADRLDALGAIGLCRCLMLAGQMNRKLMNEDDPFCQTRTADDTRYAIDHFYTKLLTLQEMMNTDSGRQEAKVRTEFLKSFLKQLQSEVLSPM
jgi:uncharacterized protein